MLIFSVNDVLCILSEDLGANIMNLKKWRKENILYTHSDFAMDSTQDGQMLDLLRRHSWDMTHVADWYV